MKKRIENVWSHLSTSFWFIPALMASGAMALSFLTLFLDNTLKSLTIQVFGYNRGTDGARTLLSTAAGSVITVAGVIFSITIAALAQTSSQFGPRLLRNFMRDKGNQVVLGTFTATFLYCLLILRSINGTGSQAFVPHLSISTSLLFTTCSVGVLIYFIHHISYSLQADYIIKSASSTLGTTIARLFPEKKNGDETEGKRDSSPHYCPEGLDQPAYTIRAPKSGYLQTLESELLTHLAMKYDVLLKVEVEIGTFVGQGSELVSLWPASKGNEKIQRQIQRAFLIGKRRTVERDIYFAIDQLVEMAVRALSPGINDPFTASSCIDWLGEALYQLNGRSLPRSHYADEHKTLRVIIPPVTFTYLVDTAFSQIRQTASSYRVVTLHLLKTIAWLIARTEHEEVRIALFHHAALIHRESRQKLPVHEQIAVSELYQKISDTFQK